MNTYLADRIARDHAETLLAEAAEARRARQVRRGRRARRSARTASSTGAAASRAARSGAAVAHFVSRPFSAAQQWIAAGQL